MTKLTEAAGRVIAGDMTNAFNAADLALLSSARVTASVLEGTEHSGMHPRTKQKLLESMIAGYGKMLEGRREMVQAHGQMVVIHRQSNIDTIDFGCWGAPQRIFTEAKASQPAEEAPPES